MGELAGPADELAGGHRLVAGDLSIDVLEFGATIQRLHVRDRGGIRRNVVLGHATVADYRASTAYFGGIIGRYANRIAGARLRLDGQEFPLQANETSATLHGTCAPGPLSTGQSTESPSSWSAPTATAASRVRSPSR